MNRSMPGHYVQHKLLEFTQTHVPSSHLILCCPLLLLPPIPPSIRVFSDEWKTLWMRLPEYWSFSFSISPSNEQPGLISFTMDWLDLLAVQETLKVLLIRWQNIGVSVSINPSHEYAGLISFRMDWLDLLEVQGTLSIKSTQHPLNVL